MLLGTKFEKLTDNTFDYGIKGTSDLSLTDIENKLKNLHPTGRSELRIYVHIPFCIQKCSFCAYSEGNSVQPDEALNYVSYIKKQLDDVLSRTGMQGIRIRSVHVGGGSPDLLGDRIGPLLSYLTELDGFTDTTALSVEFSLSSLRKKFITQLKRYPVTKGSFGVQTLNPRIRHYLKMPSKVRRMDEVTEALRETIPIVNVDLMTGFPTQTLSDVIGDLEHFIHHPSINAISTYLFRQSTAPAFLADVISGKTPRPPSEIHHASLRLHSCATLLSHGWKRSGTNTYMDVCDISEWNLSLVQGNEYPEAHHYDDYLIGVGPSAVSCFPGLRTENKSNLNEWMADIDNSLLPYDLTKCSDEERRDMALWAFPLNGQGLHKETLDNLIRDGHISPGQLATFNDYIEQGLIRLNMDAVYQLTITGEVLQDRLVKGLKKPAPPVSTTDYIQDGHTLASPGRSDLKNQNTRQERTETPLKFI